MFGRSQNLQKFDFFIFFIKNCHCQSVSDSTKFNNLVTLIFARDSSIYFENHLQYVAELMWCVTTHQHTGIEFKFKTD